MSEIDTELRGLMTELQEAWNTPLAAPAKAKSRKRGSQDDVTEALYQAEIWRTLAARPDVRLWRQNAGNIAFRTKSGTHAFRGAPKGAADLTGIVRPEGWRLEIEVKGPAYRRGKDKDRDEAQDAWAEFIQTSGGVYLFAHWHKAHGLHENVDRVMYQLDVELAKKRGTLFPQKKERTE